MNFANIDIKKHIAEKGYTQKQVAEKLDITPEWLCRILKNELGDEEKQAIRMAIDFDDLELWDSMHNKKHNIVSCSLCGAKIRNPKYTNYCPNCGADMREP